MFYSSQKDIQKKERQSSLSSFFTLMLSSPTIFFWPSTRAPNQSSYLGIEFGNKIEVFLQVSSQNCLNDEEAEMLELHVVEVDQEVVLRPWHEKVPGSSSVVVLQDGAVVVQHRLRKQRGQLKAEKPLSKRNITMRKRECHWDDAWGWIGFGWILFYFFFKELPEL